MSVPVSVEIPLVTFARSNGTRQDRLCLWSKEFYFDIEEVNDDVSPVVVNSNEDEIEYRSHEGLDWLIRIGPRPQVKHHYRWFFPTIYDRPGEFVESSMYAYVPNDRRTSLARAWDRALAKDSRNTPPRQARDVDVHLVEQQLKDRQSYGDNFKVVGDGLYRISAEPFFMMRDDGFIVGSHSSESWLFHSRAPWELYSCGELESVVRMSHTLDTEALFRNSIERFYVCDHPSFTPSFVEERMGLLCFWFWNRLRAFCSGLGRRDSKRLCAALCDEIEGGREAVEQIALGVYRGIINEATFGLAETIMQRASSGAISRILRQFSKFEAVIEVLKEEWDNRIIGINF